MIGTRLATELEQRAAAFLAAGPFSADADHLRAASVLGAAARVARIHGMAGLEGYLAALTDIGSDRDRLASASIRAALDVTIVQTAADNWLRRPAGDGSFPTAA
jgi:hypothetical protein